MTPPKLTLVSNNENPTQANPTTEEDMRGTNNNTDPASSAPIENDVQRVISEVEAAAAGFLSVNEERREKQRAVEAVLFQATEPLDDGEIASRVGGGVDVDTLNEIVLELQETYANRGVNLKKVAGKWAFRTAEDLSHLLEVRSVEERRLSKAALETLAIIAYHQPVTRAEIEDIRGVTTSAGTLDILMESGWIRPRGRRRAPGKPLTYGTTESFLSHFGLDTVKDLPGLADLRAAGLLDGSLPPDFSIPDPSAVAALMPDELPLESGDESGQETLFDDNEEEIDEELVDDRMARSALPNATPGAIPSSDADL